MTGHDLMQNTARRISHIGPSNHHAYKKGPAGAPYTLSKFKGIYDAER